MVMIIWLKMVLATCVKGTVDERYPLAAKEQTDKGGTAERSVYAEPVPKPTIWVGLIGSSPPLDPDV